MFKKIIWGRKKKAHRKLLCPAEVPVHSAQRSILAKSNYKKQFKAWCMAKEQKILVDKKAIWRAYWCRKESNGN